MGTIDLQRFGKGFCAFLVPLILACTGCQSNHLMRSAADRVGSQASFLRWNLRSLVVEPRESCRSRAFQIASLSNRELAELMRTRPAPEKHALAGQWKGINKGVGAAMLGLTQDVKAFRDNGQCVSGYNILVEQVPIRDLPCRGWQAVRDPKTCKPKTMGNFVAVDPQHCNDPLTLNYTIAKNPWYDPSRFLIDELVVIDDDLLLGRANVHLGRIDLPVAYFVLTREEG